MRSIWGGMAVMLWLLPMSMVAAQQTNATSSEAEASGEQWFNRMQQAMQRLNFDAAFVYVRGERVEPFRWLHGYHPNGYEVEVLSGLNGPEFKALRHNNQVSYYHAAGNPYSLRSPVVEGPLPTGFFKPFADIQSAYNAVSVGGGRVVDRPAQHIRIVARDRQRYGYSIWLDRETGMLLRSATLSVEGDVLEQIQLTHLQISEDFPDSLGELVSVTKPPLIDDLSNRDPVKGAWQFNWLPDGFELVRSNHHRLVGSGEPSDYFLFSDGLAQVSVYITDGNAMEPEALAGTDSLYSTRLNNRYAVTVIGRLPLDTVQRIATSVREE